MWSPASSTHSSSSQVFGPRYTSIGHPRWWNSTLSCHYLLLYYFVILCYGIEVISRRLVAYDALLLIIEINSVFLHNRHLTIIVEESNTYDWYKINSILNVGPFSFSGYFWLDVWQWMTLTLSLLGSNPNQVYQGGGGKFIPLFFQSRSVQNWSDPHKTFSIWCYWPPKLINTICGYACKCMHAQQINLCMHFEYYLQN